jgi:hypothetical protein
MGIGYRSGNPHQQEPTVNTATAIVTPTQDQFDALRQQIANLEKQVVPERRDAATVTAPTGRRQRSRTKGQQTMSDTTTTAAAAASNLPKLNQLLADMEQLGEQHALGADWQVKFDLKLLEAANAGVLDLTKDKHGDGIDDAIKASEAYAKGRNKAVIFDHKEAKQRKLASTSRLMIRLGGSPKWGVQEPMATVNQLLTIRQNLRKTANKGTRLDDAHNTLMRFAREQLKKDTMIAGDDALKAFCYRADSEPRTADDWMRQVLKQAIALSTGKLSNCPDLDNSAELKAVIANLNKRLTAIAKQKGQASTQAAA